MENYEFQTALGNGLIQIPVEYLNKLSGKIKVILVPEDIGQGEKYEKAAVKKTAFPYFAIDTTGYVFDREEANER